jgi:protein TonB
MASVSLADQLQDAIEMMLAEPDSAPPKADLNIGELLGIAAELRLLPDPMFRTALRAELMTPKRSRLRTPVAITLLAQSNGWLGNDPCHDPRTDQRTEDVLPTLFGAGYGAYPVHRGNFAVSAAVHVALIAVVATVGVLANRKPWAPRATSVVVTDISPYMLPPSSEVNRGGGGGGDRDKKAESKGSLPRFSREQVAPPAIVVRNEEPKLPEQPTVVGPPQLTMPITSQLGNPLAAALEPPSNGTGSGGGMSSGAGGGIGSGTGPGVGPGRGGGVGGGVFRVGGGVSAPRAIYAPDPQYSDEARRAKYQGTVVLWVVIGPDGRPRDLNVVRTLGMGLDEKALEAVRQWRFEPAMKDGHPVAVEVNIEVSFRLY